MADVRIALVRTDDGDAPTLPMSSPLVIEIMFAYYCSPVPWHYLREGAWDSEAGKDARKMLASCDLIDEVRMTATERGKAWVRYILDTPLPTRIWTLPDRRAELVVSDE